LAVTIDILNNDEDPDGDTLVLDSVFTAANGSIEVNPDQTVTYTPDSDFIGSDSFIYAVSDGKGGTDTATVTVTVTETTVLVANFMNGNNAFLASRIYLWNPSMSAGQCHGSRVYAGA